MRLLFWIIRVDFKYNQKCPWKREADLTTVEKRRGNMVMRGPSDVRERSCAKEHG